MKKIILISVTIVSILTSCASSKNRHCEAYGDNDTDIKNIDII